MLTTHEMPALRDVERYRGTQGLDGTAFVSYYDKDRLLSFVWDGLSDDIEVSYGGYAEPVYYLAPAPEVGTTVGGFCGHVEKILRGENI